MYPHSIKRILHVDDDANTASMLCGLLSLINCHVTTAATFADALDKIRTEHFDLYLFDTWLPGGSGVELCRQIRTSNSRTSIVFYSAAAFDSDRQEALEAGAQAYLVKPTDVDKLMDTINRFLISSARAASGDAEERG